MSPRLKRVDANVFGKEQLVLTVIIKSAIHVALITPFPAYM